jgi:hypothetical protein
MERSCARPQGAVNKDFHRAPDEQVRGNSNALSQERRNDLELAPKPSAERKLLLVEGGWSVHRFHRQFADRQGVPSMTALDQADRKVA